MARFKTIFNPKYKSFIDDLTKARKKANLSQRALAELIGETHPFITSIERKQRRMDLLESINIMKAIGMSESEIVKVIKKLI